MKSYTYRIIIEPDGKAYHGYAPALHGCHTYGASIEETKKNIRDAITLYVQHLCDKGADVPEENSFEGFETVMLSKAYA
ncbi:MAG: type II toxin-antitoxin system HicB family antitoxin [bacterium]|nr:type II toxin-antitoxin system HicB family antitoxin [bacterium]MDZ4205877.1 type II toxin-antitoxin system HicB family antitoxin [Patescibacteria group bacterium]